jgi:heptosyltransferase-2
LIVRLRNWVGDVLLGLPMLQRLADAGYAPRLVGKGWAVDLLAGHGWPVQPLAGTARGRIAQLRALAREARADDPGFDRRLNALCLPYSFSSALECRLAGLRALGHAHEARGWLLGRAVPRREDVHELAVYWQLGDALLGEAAPLPARLGLRVTQAHRTEAARRLAERGLQPGGAAPIVVCPFAGGTWSGQDKTWPAFAAFVAEDLPSFGRPVVVCPGPGEEAEARQRFGTAHVLEGLRLGPYAALLRQSALMISNDTGPGHLAAAVGAPLLSVLGPSDPARWGAWGDDVQWLRGEGGTWPSRAAVRAAVAATLARGHRAGGPTASPAAGE